MLVGVGEATLTPAALSMMADVLPRQRLALATGIYYAGIPVGTALSLLIASWLAPRFGWRSCFYVLGLAGLLLSGVLLFLRDPRQERSGSLSSGSLRPGQEDRPAILSSLGRVLVTLPTYGLTILGGSLLCYGSAAALHAITWLVQERGFTFEAAASRAGIIAVMAGFFGNLAGGWFADACQRRWEGGRLWALVIITIFTTPAAVALYLLPPDTPLFYVCWVVAVSATTAYFGPLFAVLQEVSPARIRSTGVAFGLLGLNLLGVGPGPWITGLIGDAWSLTRGLLVAQAVVFSAIVPFILAARCYVRDVQRAAAM
jgi:MFS family permease